MFARVKLRKLYDQNQRYASLLKEIEDIIFNSESDGEAINLILSVLEGIKNKTEFDYEGKE